MPSSKRKPIDYTPAGGSIFRPAREVADDLAAVEDPDEGTEERITERPENRTTGRTVERTDAPPLVQPRVRHSFDIRADQLDALYELQEARRKRFGKKPTMGQLVEAALDAYLARIE